MTRYILLLLLLCSCNKPQYFDGDNDRMTSQFAPWCDNSSGKCTLVITNALLGWKIYKLTIDKLCIIDLLYDTSVRLSIPIVDSLDISCILVSDAESITVSVVVPYTPRLMLNTKTLDLQTISFNATVIECDTLMCEP